MSTRALPDLLSECTCNITVLDFLEADIDDELKLALENLEMELLAVAEFFNVDQLEDAKARLEHLLSILDGFDAE